MQALPKMTLMDLGDDEIYSLTTWLDIVSVSRLERVARRMHDLKLVNNLKLDRAKFIASANLVKRLDGARPNQILRFANELSDNAAQEDGDDCRRELAHAGAVPAVCRAMNRVGPKSVAAFNCAAALWNLTTNNVAMPSVDVVEQLVTAGGVPPLVRLITEKLPSESERAAKFAAITLSNAMSMAAHTSIEVIESVENAVRMAGVPLGLYPKLVSLLDAWAAEEDDIPALDGTLPATGLLWNLANRSKQSSESIGEQPGCVEKLLGMLEHCNGEMRISAAGVLCNLVREASNAIKVKEAPGALEILRTFRADKTRRGLDASREAADDKRTVAKFVKSTLRGLKRHQLIGMDEDSSSEEDGSEEDSEEEDGSEEDSE